jgi:uncharacterized protein (DUF58 family)
MLSPDEALQLDGLVLGVSAAAPAATAAGLRQARSRGYGVEFRDFRRYQPGDDPRRIDWTVHARLRQLVVRVSHAEGQARLHLLVDRSASMALGSKLACAGKVAAALAYVAAGGQDAVGAASFDETVRDRVPLGTGRAQVLRILEALGRATPGGRSDIDRALTDYAGAVRGPGLAVVVSDFLCPGSGREGLAYLLHRGLEPAVVQVLADEDLDPDIAGDVELADVEDPEAPPLLVSEAAVADYRARLTELSAELRELCQSRGLPWMRVAASLSFAELLDEFLAAGLVAARA